MEVRPGFNELIAFSAQQGVVADDGPSSGNSPFAAALAKWLVEPGMEIRFVMGNVRDEVMNNTGPTEDRDGPQIPYIEGSLGGEQIVLRVVVEKVQEKMKIKPSLDKLATIRSSKEFKFENYKAVPKRFKYKGDILIPEIYLDQPHRMDRNGIIKVLEAGVNFAGNNTLISWSCGMYCQIGAIVNRRTGKFVPLPTSTLGYEFEADSLLLVTDADFSYYGDGEDEPPQGLLRGYYLWNEKLQSLTLLFEDSNPTTPDLGLRSK